MESLEFTITIIKNSNPNSNPQKTNFSQIQIPKKTPKPNFLIPEPPMQFFFILFDESLITVLIDYNRMAFTPQNWIDSTRRLPGVF